MVVVAEDVADDDRVGRRERWELKRLRRTDCVDKEGLIRGAGARLAIIQDNVA